MEKLRVGNPLDKSIDIGAIVAPVQLKKIQSIVKKGEIFRYCRHLFFVNR